MEISNGTVQFDISTLQWLVYTGIPFVVDLIGRRFADGRVKAGILAVLALLTAIAQDALQSDGSLSLPSLAGKFIAAIITAWTLHKFVWEPIRLTGDRGLVQATLPYGIGAEDPAKKSGVTGSG